MIAVRHDRDDIDTLFDLEGKIVAASEIVEFDGWANADLRNGRRRDVLR